jgi:hypothetical protein
LRSPAREGLTSTHEKPVRGASSLLHSFSQDQIERRQYQRVEIQFPLWWLKDFKGNETVAGIGLEISGGGLQFLLEEKIELQCSLAFNIEDRRMRANVLVVQSAVCWYKERQWHRHRAKFVGLMNGDFDYITAFTEAYARKTSEGASAAAPRTLVVKPKPKQSVGSLESYDMLPLRVQETIVAKLVELKRLVPPHETRLALLAAHYGGIQPANDDNVFHQFFIRTRMNSPTGPLIFNTEVLVSDNGKDVVVRD